MASRLAGRLTWGTFTPLFCGLATIYVAHRTAAWLQFPRPFWLRSYLDDLLCLPLLLTVTLFLMRMLYGPQVRFTKYHIGFVVAYVSLVFELLLPRYMERYTSDLLDVVLYALGGWFFHRFLNK
ncbi:hypothetical protein [Rufibacter hautae]|uniref:Magnesium citrate secondary transporter n=1 Tax=Rufibacter hautae TaxID=2595005 RepID=A0A5B6TSM8_9BACT|nr:hypothetical protein [Rufibacter hautae]KAA3439488.1 hypothetical protein FOA19_02025 [Rufibacter hautae]